MPGGGAFASFGPTPLGYTDKEWQAFLENALETGVVVENGGVQTIVVEVDQPLTYLGTPPQIEEIELTAEEMAKLVVEPGDLFDDSVTGNAVLYSLAEEENDYGSASDATDEVTDVSSGDLGSSDGVEGDVLTGYRCDPPYYCQLWNAENGSGLVWEYQTYIRISSKSASATVTRTGSATFPLGYSAPVTFNGGTSYAWYTTYYARLELVWNGFVWVSVWVVYSATNWVYEGENAWDSIVFGGDGFIGSNAIDIDQIQVYHNGYKVADSGNNVTLNSANPTYDFTFALEAKKTSLLCGVTHGAPVAMMGDFCQGAWIDYPVNPHTGSDFGGSLHPYAWCTEFASWGFVQNDPLLGACLGCAHIPQAGAPKIDFPVNPIDDYWGADVGVGAYFEWSGNRGIRLYFGDDTSTVNNGADATEWASLANGIGAGDYVARMQCTDSICSGWIAHSMVVIGWGNGTNATPCTVGSGYFSSARMCNALATVSGNKSGAPGRAERNWEVVCQRPVWSWGTYSWVDPPCDYNVDGNPDACTVRLWDTHLNNSGSPYFGIEGDFFALMP